MDGVAAVYVDKVVKIHLTEDKELDEEVVKSTLKGFKMNTKSVKKSDSLPF